jgi:uncharacterized protein YbjT (DUF2867 family)
MHSDKYVDVPHFTGKYAIERMIEHTGIAATILRPAYFIQNDANLKEAILRHGVYPMPIGGLGLSMVDTRDIAEVAALHLLKRDRSAAVLPLEVLDVAGPGVLTGQSVATIWAEVLNKPIRYAGDDVAAYERQLTAFLPAWMAYDLRTMLARFQSDGLVAESGNIQKLTALLGRPLRSYRDFAVSMAQTWQAA